MTVGETTVAGVFPVLCTPFESSGTLDERSFDAVIEFVVEAGANGCVFPGVASEVDTLEDDERRALVTRLGQRLDGRVPFVVGASAATPDAVAVHIRHGARAGATAAMVMAPASIGRDTGAQRAFVERASELAHREGLPILLQNAPVPIGAGLSPAEVAAVAIGVERIRFVKEETLPCGQHLSGILEAAELTPGAIDGVFGGAGARYLIDELARGSIGTMPACELSDLHVRLVSAWREGEIEEARRLFEASLPMLSFQAVFRMHMTKATLARRGVLASTRVRGAGPVPDAADLAELGTLLVRLAPELALRPPFT